MRTFTMAHKVAEFHTAFGRQRDLPFSHNTVPDLELREDLLKEEYREVMEAIDNVHAELVVDGVASPENKEALLKELVDLLYVTLGMADTFGLDIETAFNRVHASNMSKLVDGKPVLREDGKVLKGPNYQPPNLGDLVA